MRENEAFDYSGGGEVGVCLFLWRTTPYANPARIGQVAPPPTWNPKLEARNPGTENPTESLKPKPETRDPKPDKNPEPETRNTKPETRTPKPETRNLKPKTRNTKHEIRNPKPKTRNLKPEIRLKPETREPETRKPETRNPKPANHGHVLRGPHEAALPP